MSMQDEQKNSLQPAWEIRGEYLLEKYPGKGGWTYAAIPQIRQDGSVPFGWRTISGSIDGYALQQHKLMPMGNGQLFLPVKAAIRKVIKKEAGDWVTVHLYPDEVAFDAPADFFSYFDYEAPEIRHFFETLNPSEKKAYANWVDAAKSEEVVVKRVAEMMQKLEKGLKFHEKTS